MIDSIRIFTWLAELTLSLMLPVWRQPISIVEWNNISLFHRDIYRNELRLIAWIFELKGLNIIYPFVTINRSRLKLRTMSKCIEDNETSVQRVVDPSSRKWGPIMSRLWTVMVFARSAPSLKSMDWDHQPWEKREFRGVSTLRPPRLDVLSLDYARHRLSLRYTSAPMGHVTTILSVF